MPALYDRKQPRKSLNDTGEIPALSIRPKTSKTGCFMPISTFRVHVMMQAAHHDGKLMSGHQLTLARAFHVRLGEHCLRLLARRALRLQVKDLHRWQAHRDALVVANHVSYIDGPLLACISPHALTYAVTADFAKHPVWRRALDVLVRCGLGRYVPVDAASPFGMRKILRELHACRGAMVFPEGGITRDGLLGPLHPGAAIAAMRSGRVLLPVRIHGLERSVFGKVKRRRLTWLPPVTVEVGEPINPAGLNAQQLQARIAEALS